MKQKFITTKYTLFTDKLPQGKEIRLALIADIHERDVSPLLPLLQEEKPDLVCLVGDTFERRDFCENPFPERKRTWIKRFLYFLIEKYEAVKFFFTKKKSHCSENAYRFINQLSNLKTEEGTTPERFLSLGNHEWCLIEQDREELQNNNIHLLDNADETVTIKGIPLLIGGLSTKIDPVWLKEFSEKQGLKILLSHHPEYFDGVIEKDKVELILSGHVHGGQIRLFKRAIFSPDKGLFPKYYHGVYENKMVVSAGCANTGFVPRFFNPCELVIISLCGK